MDLILYKNEGRLFDFIPSNIHILPEAFTYNGKLGGLRKRVQGILSGYLLKARIENLRIKKRGMSQQILYDFHVNQLSRKIDGHYDIAIGFLEGWADRYIASTVDAKAMDLPETERIKMGEKAKHFVVKEKNPEKQCKKILELIGRLE